MTTLEQQKQIAAENLKTIKSILDEMGISFCLFLGTALGGYRDHDFCPGDVDDIDIAVSTTDYSRAPEMITKIVAAGFTHHTYQDKDGVCPEIAFQKNYEDWRSKIDIFFVSSKDDKKFMWTFYSHPPQNKVFNHFTPFEKVIFYGTEYNTPSPIESYLEENYGKDWKTPISRENWDWSKDNKCLTE